MRRGAALLPLAAACNPAPSTHPTGSILDLAGYDARVATPATFASAPTPAPTPCPSPRRRLGDGLTAERRPLDASPALDLEPCFDVVRADSANYHLVLL